MNRALCYGKIKTQSYIYIYNSMWSTNKVVVVVVNPTPSPPTSGKRKKNKQ